MALEPEMVVRKPKKTLLLVVVLADSFCSEIAFVVKSYFTLLCLYLTDGDVFYRSVFSEGKMNKSLPVFSPSLLKSSSMLYCDLF